MSERLLSVTEVAEILRQSNRFVVDELRRKNLVGSKFGGQWHISAADVDSYVEAHRNVRAVVRRRSA